MKALVLTAVSALALAFSGSALAADPTPFGGATVANGVATLVSDTSVANTPTNDYSGLTLPLPAGLTLAQITQLSADFNVTDDDCIAGSPRFVINYGGGQNFSVYFGPSPNFTGCGQNTWLSTGNLVGTSEALRVDTSHLTGGAVNSTWAQALALVGTLPITSINLIVDSGWALADKEQTVLVRSIKLNNETFLVPAAPKPPKVNPTTACKAELAAIGRTAFNEHWAKDGTSNGMGKCVSTAAKARNLAAMQSQIMNAAKTCKAKGLKGAKLGACVAARDGLAATLTEQAEHAKKGKAKGRR
jgi:hypothetical protein